MSSAKDVCMKCGETYIIGISKHTCPIKEKKKEIKIPPPGYIMHPESIDKITELILAMPIIGTMPIDEWSDTYAEKLKREIKSHIENSDDPVRYIMVSIREWYCGRLQKNKCQQGGK